MKRAETTTRLGSVAPERQCWIDADTDVALVACRSAYQAAVGVDPGAYEVRHHCRVTRCVRPSHLVLGCNDSELNALFVDAAPARADARLTEAVRLAHAEGESSRALSARFNLPRVHVVDLIEALP